jgi:tetratricopeptide (TPR) repeat protein
MRGDVLLRLQTNGTAALREYKAALEMHPNDPAILERIAEAQLASGQLEAARDTASVALKIDSHRTGCKRTLAKIAMDQRDYASALPYLRELVEQDPRDVSTRVELGTACAQTGALDEALRNLGPALAAGYPDQKGSLHYLLGTVLRKMGRADDAERAFAAARELSDTFQQTSRRGQNEQP